MELPFKYIVLCIIKSLHERQMPLTINKNTLINYVTVVIGDLLYTIEEKKELRNNFDFQYELDDLLDKYYSYFQYNGNEIVFDDNYTDELSNLIDSEIEEYDAEDIENYDFVIEGNIILLEMIGVKINKTLYNFLLDIEKDIEECYDELYGLESNTFDLNINKNDVCSKLKRLYMKKIVMITNIKNILPNVQYYDVLQYSSDIVDRINDDEDLIVLYDCEYFDVYDIVNDAFLRSIFTSSDSYICNLNETFVMNCSEKEDNKKNNRIKFYAILLNLIDDEIKKTSGLLKEELIKVKYRLMNTLDTVCGTATFINGHTYLDSDYVGEYDFISNAAYYFINELLMYDDDKYRNNSCDTENIILYLDNMMKKMIIKAYYNLTHDNAILEEIKNNELYGVNNISSDFLKEIIENPKTKKKGV